jgi:hypothetical protein
LFARAVKISLNARDKDALGFRNGIEVKFVELKTSVENFSMLIGEELKGVMNDLGEEVYQKVKYTQKKCCLLKIFT